MTKEFKNTFSHETHSETRNRFAISALWTLTLLVISWLSFGIQFATNDDGSIMSFISGAVTGRLEPYVGFTGPFFSAPIALLYGLTDAVPWYILVYMLFCFLSCWTICQTMLKNCADLRQQLIRLVMFAVLYVCLYLSICVRPQFTTIPALCGSAAVAITLFWNPANNKGANRLALAALAFFFLMASNIRTDVGLVTLVVLFGTVVLLVLQKKMSLSWAAVIVAEVVGIYVLTQLAVAWCQSGEWAFYIKFNPIRARFSDYPTAPFEEMRDVYASIGWDETLYRMAKSWYFLDHRCNYEAFSTLAQANASWARIDNSQAVFLPLLTSIPMLLSFGCLSIPLIWIFFRILQVKEKKERFWQSFASICYAIGGFALILYFAWGGRIPTRIIEMVLCLSLTPCVLTLISIDPPTLSRVAQRVAACGATVCFALLLTFSLKQLTLRIDNRPNPYWESDQAEAYCAQHPEYLYIKPYYATEIRTMLVNTMDKPHNIIFWGGSLYPSPLYMHQLQYNGYEQFDETNLFDEKVRFINSSEPSEDTMAYLRSLYPSASWILTDETDGVQVYQFIK